MLVDSPQVGTSQTVPQAISLSRLCRTGGPSETFAAAAWRRDQETGVSHPGDTGIAMNWQSWRYDSFMN